MIEALLHAPASAYYLVLLLLSAAVFKLVSDSRRVRAVNYLQQLAFEKTRRHHAPKLTVLITDPTIAAVTATVEAFKACYTPVDFIIVVDSSKDQQLANQFRRIYKKSTHSYVRVAAWQDPDLIAIVEKFASGSLILAVAAGAKPTRAFYKLAIMPFIERTWQAVQLSLVILPEKSLTSGIAALASVLSGFVDNMFSRADLSLVDLLPKDIIFRRSALRKNLSKSSVCRTRQTSHAVGYRANTEDNILALQRSSRLMLALIICILVLVPLITGLLGADSALVVASLAAYAVVGWWLVSGRHIFSLSQTLSLVLLMPLFLLVFPLWSITALFGRARNSSLTSRRMNSEFRTS